MWAIDGQNPGDHSAGPPPYLDSFPEQPGSQSQMQPATMLQLDDSWASCFIPTDADPFGFPASMQFPTRYQDQAGEDKDVFLLCFISS